MAVEFSAKHVLLNLGSASKEEVENFISKLSDSQIEEIIKELNNSHFPLKNEKLIFLSILNKEKRGVVFAKKQFNSFPVSLERGTLITKAFFGSNLKVEGGTVLFINEGHERDIINCSDFKKGFLNFIEGFKLENINEGLINFYEVRYLLINKGFAVFNMCDNINLGEEAIINADYVKSSNIKKEKGYIITRYCFGVEEYRGLGKKELTEINNEILGLNNYIIKLLRSISEEDYKHAARRIRDCNKRQLQLILKQEKIIKKHNINQGIILLKNEVLPDEVKVGDNIYRKFKEDELEKFQLQIYPKLEQKEIPAQMLVLIKQYDYSLKKLKDKYSKLFKEAKSFLQRIDSRLRINKKTPKLVVKYWRGGLLFDFLGSYIKEDDTIEMRCDVNEPEIVLFHEIMHSFIDINFPWMNLKENYNKKIYLMVDGKNVERRYKDVNEGLTDFLTLYYFKNYDKERKYTIDKTGDIVDYITRTAGPGYYKEAEEVGNELLRLVTKENKSFKEAMEILLKKRIINQKNRNV